MLGLDASIIMKFSTDTTHWWRNLFPLSVIQIFPSKIGKQALLSMRAYINIGHTILLKEKKNIDPTKIATIAKPNGI